MPWKGRMPARAIARGPVMFVTSFGPCARPSVSWHAALPAVSGALHSTASDDALLQPHDSRRTLVTDELSDDS